VNEPDTRAAKACTMDVAVRKAASVMPDYKGRKVTLNRPFRTPSGPKKSAVYVRGPNGKVKIVRFGDPNMSIKKNNPKRRKSFRARHKCSTAKDKTTPRYWSCKAW